MADLKPRFVVIDGSLNLNATQILDRIFYPIWTYNGERREVVLIQLTPSHAVEVLKHYRMSTVVVVDGPFSFGVVL